MSRKSFHERIEELPAYDDLPSMPDVPQGAIWGLWDKDGIKDELGSLNLLTPRTVAGAAQEIRLGVSVSLNLSMDKPKVPVFERQKLQHTIRDNRTFSSSQSFDDKVLFNTQAGSQWDGLRHVIHEQSGLLYNGFKESCIVGPEANDVLGIHRWHERGCIAGRGVLIDFVEYARRHDIEYDPSKYFPIFCKDLETAAHEQKVSFKPGDILLVRTGFLKWYNECTDHNLRDSWFSDPAKGSVGVAAIPDMVPWLWNHHFTALAADNLAWEAIPFPDNMPSLHQYLLASWGTPIGELWDLEELAERCIEFGRYSFFITSVPLNIPGGVASPPNAMAIF